MTCSWRIRHKLMLGLGLVMAIMGLLLGGTLKGLASYRATMRTIESKLVELTEADNFWSEIKVLPTANDHVDQAKKALADFDAKLDALSAHGDQASTYKEKEYVKGLWEKFDQLEAAFESNTNTSILKERASANNNGEKADPIKNAIHELDDTAKDLHNSIYSDLKERIKTSKKEYNVSFAIIVTTSVLAALLMAGLLRFFYRSVAHPMRDLEQGVGRVAKGDFEHRIVVRSGDEFEDLAKAYNDMTERLRDMYRDLAQQVNERSRQLVRSERLAGVGFLAAGVAHEINNPLASIAFCSEALERRLADLFEGGGVRGNAAGNVAQEREIVTKYLKMIEDEAFRCKKITQKLLEFSRGGEHRREQTDIGDLIQVVLDMVQHLPSAKGKEVVFEPADKIVAWVNGQEIQQVFLNLVVNALESMEEGGRLIISGRIKDGMAELVFRDTGCGMTGEVLENIFEPFFTRSRTGKGTGLGLSISHRIITQHGGDIEAASQGPNQGSTFTVRVPLEASAVKPEDDSENLDPEAAFLKLSDARRERKAA